MNQLQQVNNHKKSEKGFLLMESLIAILIVCFGLLGLSKFQIGVKIRDQDNNARDKFVEIAEQLSSQVASDITNKGCYLTVASSCSSTSARTSFNAYYTQAKNIAGFKSMVVGVESSGFYSILFTWGRKSQYSNVSDGSLKIITSIK